MTQNDQRINFLLALGRSDKVSLHGFEADFVESNMTAFNLSPKQAKIVDRLMAKYEDAIGWNPNRNRLAERAAEEQKNWDADPKRYMAQAGQRPKTKMGHVQEKLKRVNSVWKLDHHPVVPGSVVREGRKLEPWFIDHKNGILKGCPFLSEGDSIEYDIYTH